mgnify:CR=1 FL=1
MADAFPVDVKQARMDDGTSVVLLSFQNRLLVMVTQLNKVGTIVRHGFFAILSTHQALVLCFQDVAVD